MEYRPPGPRSLHVTHHCLRPRATPRRGPVAGLRRRPDRDTDAGAVSHTGGDAHPPASLHADAEPDAKFNSIFDALIDSEPDAIGESQFIFDAFIDAVSDSERIAFDDAVGDTQLKFNALAYTFAYAEPDAFGQSERCTLIEDIIYCIK